MAILILHLHFREKILKGVKSRDSYGLVMSAVEKAQAIKQQEAHSRPETPHDTGE